ncbi:MAG: beta strand repeat-containing protein, partial [Allosphingosinicella sp.]
TWTEGDSAVLLDLGGNATLADADSANFDGGSLTLAITGGVAAEDVLAIVDQGTGAGQIGVSGSDVTYGGVVIGTFTGGSGGSPLAISFDADATPAAVQALMRNISYSNSGGDDPTDGDRTVTWTLVDGDGTANGGVDTLQFTTTVDVDPVNDEPEGADKDVTILEDGTHTFTTSDFGFSDPLDGGTFSFVKITTLPTAGKLFLDGVEIGAAGGDVFVQDIIDGKLTYQPEADANGTNYASFTFQVGDDGGTANGGVNTDQTPNTFTFDVTAVNDDPAIGNLDGDTVSFTEGDALMSASLDTGLDALVSDVDNVNFDGGSLRVQVTTNAVPGEDFIYFNNSNPAFGLTFSGNTLSYNGVAFATFTAPSEDRTFTFNSNATPQAVQSLVRSLTYFNSNTANPSDATRTVELTLSDGSGGSTTVATSVDVIAVNDAPTGADNTVTTSEDDAYAFTAADFGFADAAEGHELAAVIVTSLPTNGTLVLNGGQITAGHLPLTVPKADIDAGFFVFVPDADEFGTGYASFGFQVQDDGGTANGGDDTSGTYTLTIDVTPDNVAPEVDLNGAGAGVDNTATYTEQAPIVTLAADLTVADDGATLTGATVQITGGFVPLAGDGADYLGIAGSGSGTVGAISYSYSALTGVLTLSGSASVADYQALLRQVSFQSTTNDPGTSRTISWTVTDGSLSSTAVETTITVTPVNDAPVITLADATVSGTEDENVVFNAANGNAITVSDLDNATLTVTLAVANGALTLSQTTGLSFSTGDGTGDSSMTFTGSAADINAALEGLVYRGNLNYEGADTLNVEVTDGALTDTDSIAITLADDGKIDGTPGNDTLVGTPFSDFFDLSQGGSDTANALGGLDVFYMGGALDAGDNLDGGALIDQLALQGDYSGGLTLGANNLTNIEILALLSGSDDRFGDTAGNSYDYNLTLVDANVAAGDRLFIDAAQLGVGEDLIFDGSAETNGSLWFFAGKGTDNLTGGAQSDVFLFRDGGRFTADDRIDGGAGTDQLALRGNYSTQIVMQADTIKNVEAIALLSGNNTHYGPFAGNFSYNLLMHDGNVAAGKTLFVDAAQLRAGESLIFDGSQETNGVFKIWGGLGNDVLIGGAGADTIIGGGGADTMAGNGGNDIFRYFSTSDSAVGAEDTIISFFAGDIIDLSAIDARAHTPQDNAFNFIGSAAFSGSGNGSSGQLRAQNTSGNNWIIEGDTNGDGTADFRINVITADGDPITAVDFIF